MQKPKSILVVVPPLQEISPAVHRAVAYARSIDVQLHLQMFDHYAPIDYASSVFGAEVADRARSDYLEERMSWLAQQAAGLADQGLRVECDVVWAPRIHEAIIGRVLDLEPDLVIKDVACDPATQIVRLTSADWKLLRFNPAPAMLVHPRSGVLPHHVLATADVMADGDEAQFNDEIVGAARTISRLSGAGLNLLSVFSYNPMRAYGTGFIAESFDLMDSAHQQALNRFAARAKIPSSHVKRICILDTAAGITDHVQASGTDLVVLGSAYRGGLERLLFGTTAEALLRRLTCDVLLIKPAGFRAELATHMDVEALKSRYGTRSPTIA